MTGGEVVMKMTMMMMVAVMQIVLDGVLILVFGAKVSE